MEKVTLAVSRGAKVDADPHLIGWVKIAGEGDIRGEMTAAYQGLGLNPSALLQYRNKQGAELRVMYQTFVPAAHGSLEEIASAEGFAELAERWLQGLPIAPIEAL